MKIPSMLLILWVGWLASWKMGGEFAEGVTELRWMVVGASLGLAFLASLALNFVRAGRIRLDEDRLVVSTPLRGNGAVDLLRPALDRRPRVV